MAGSAWHLCWAAQWAPDCCSPFWCGWIRTFGSTCANVKATCRWPNRIRSCRCRAAAEVADVGWLADTAEALAAELIRSPCPVTRLLELIRDDTFTTGTSTRRRKLRPFLEHCESWNTFIHRMRNNWGLFEWKEWARQSRIIAPRTWPRASRTAHSSASLGPQQRTVRHAEQVMQNTRVVGFLLDTHKQLQLSDGPHCPEFSTRTSFLSTAGSELGHVSCWSNWFQDFVQKVLKTLNGPPRQVGPSSTFSGLPLLTYELYSIFRACIP